VEFIIAFFGIAFCCIQYCVSDSALTLLDLVNKEIESISDWCDEQRNGHDEDPRSEAMISVMTRLAKLSKKIERSRS